MPHTERLTRLEGLHAIQHRIHHPEAQLMKMPTLFDPRAHPIALAEAFGLVEKGKDELVYTVIVSTV